MDVNAFEKTITQTRCPRCLKPKGKAKGVLNTRELQTVVKVLNYVSKDNRH